MPPFDSRKISLVFRPVLARSAGFVVVYNLLAWSLVYKMEWVDPAAFWLPADSVLALFLPMIFYCLAHFLFIRWPLRLLELETKGFDRERAIILLLSIAIVGSTGFIQVYLIRNAGSLSHLDTINQIDSLNPPRLCTVRHAYADFGHGRHDAFIREKTGRKPYLHFYYFLAMPLRNSEADTTASRPAAILGVCYKEDGNRDWSAPQRDSAFQAFLEWCKAKAERVNYSEFAYLRQRWTDDESIYRSLLSDSNVDTHAVPVYRAFQKPLGWWGMNLLLISLMVFVVGQALVLLAILVIPFNHQFLTDW